MKLLKMKKNVKQINLAGHFHIQTRESAFFFNGYLTVNVEISHYTYVYTCVHVCMCAFVIFPELTALIALLFGLGEFAFFTNYSWGKISFSTRMEGMMNADQGFFSMHFGIGVATVFFRLFNISNDDQKLGKFQCISYAGLFIGNVLYF